jgi:hypothetical protein
VSPDLLPLLDMAVLADKPVFDIDPIGLTEPSRTRTRSAATGGAGQFDRGWHDLVRGERAVDVHVHQRPGGTCDASAHMILHDGDGDGDGDVVALYPLQQAQRTVLSAPP